jgi:Arc/MetJ-type ribon-helix-helix transcriptional regulator
MPRRTIRLSSATDERIESAAKLGGYSSPSAFLRAAINRELGQGREGLTREFTMSTTRLRWKQHGIAAAYKPNRLFGFGGYFRMASRRFRSTSWAMQSRSYATSSTFARPPSVLSSVALFLKTTVGVDGLVGIRRRLRRLLPRQNANASRVRPSGKSETLAARLLRCFPFPLLQ